MKKIINLVYVFVFFLTALALAKSCGAGVNEDGEQYNSVIVLDQKIKGMKTEEGGRSYWAHVHKLPENLAAGQVLLVESYVKELEVLLDGECIYTFSDPYRESGKILKWIELPDEAAGGTLTLRTVYGRTMKQQEWINNAYLGTRGQLILYLIRNNLWMLITGILLIAMSILVAVYALKLGKKLSGNSRRSVWFLCIFILLAGIWILSDSEVAQLFVQHTSAVMVLSFAAFMLMPIFFLLFIQSMLTCRKKILDIAGLFLMINTGVTFGLYLFRIKSLYYMIPVHHVLILLTMLVLLKCCMEEVIRYKSPVMKKIIIGILFLIVFGIGALAVFYACPIRNYSFVYSVGSICFVLSLVNAVLADLSYQLEKGANLSVYKSLALLDSMTSMGNRAAFIREQENDAADRQFVYIMMDLNGLKQVNDQYGHQEGDLMIEGAAKCIRDIFERQGRCYRIGGDEFVVVLDDVLRQETEQMLAQLQGRIDRENQEREHPIKIAWGYAVKGQDGDTAQELYQQADARMYERKKEMKEKERQETVLR